MHPPMTTIRQSSDDVLEAGGPAEAGSFTCLDCSFPISLDHPEEMPHCPSCGGARFRRASMFDQPTLRNFAAIKPAEAPSGWLEGVRAAIEQPGRYVAFFADGRARVFELDEGWSRIGRSGSAKVHLDDPTVSRRHAVVVCTPEGELRALDDRSTNGIRVNGELVDWAPLSDGDQLQVGRYTLHVIESPGSAGA